MKTSNNASIADAIFDLMETSGFNQVDVPRCNELVFERGVSQGKFVQVYTSIVGSSVRSKGKDAIRVVGIYKGSKGDLPIFKAKRVNRVGDASRIAERVLSRMREAWTEVRYESGVCHCGAPKAISKAGNFYCAERCWLD